MSDEKKKSEKEQMAETKKLMQAVAAKLDDVFEGYGFCLMVFDWGDKAQMNYISNAERETMIEALKEAVEVVSKN